MKVRLNVQMSGTRDGVRWPPIGSEVELPDDEARTMLASGMASPLREGDRPETAVSVPDDVDEAREEFVPETGKHVPVIPVESLPEEDRRPDMSVVGLADDGSLGAGPANPPSAIAPATEDETVDMVKRAEALTTDTGPVRRAQRKPATSKKASESSDTENK